MGRLIGCVMLMVLGGFAVQPAQARERKSAAAADRAAVSAMTASREAHAKSVRQDASRTSVDRAAASAAVAGTFSSNRNRRPMAPLREQQEARPNALTVKLGAVTLQPAVGGIKGAQFSIGF